MLGQLWKQAGEQSLAVNWGSRRESDEIPMEYLSTPHAPMHASLSIHSRTVIATTSDVLHWKAPFPSLEAVVSKTQRFPEDATEKEHIPTDNSSHIISPTQKIPPSLKFQKTRKKESLVKPRCRRNRLMC